MVDLRKLERRIVRTLSGGELSRASLATALLGEPELLVLDEPTSGSTPCCGEMVGIFPFISMFLVTSIAMLRERTSGTLERLMSLAKLDLLLGYGIAFAVVAAAQASITAGAAFGLLDLDVDGPVWIVVVLSCAG